jgi:hypothetical protein
MTPRIVGWVPVAPSRRRLTLFGMRPVPVTVAVTVTLVGVLTTIKAGVVLGVLTVGDTTEVRGFVTTARGIGL